MPNAKVTLLVCLSLSFAVGATINSLASSLLVFQKAFGASNEVLGRIQLLFFAGGGMIVVAGGWITERLGEKKAAIAALCCLCAGSLLVASARSLTWVLASAILFGFGCIWSQVAYSVIISRQYPNRRQSMFSIVSLSETVSAILQPIAFSYWFSHVQSTSGEGWLSAFLGLAAIPFLALAVVSAMWNPGETAVDVKRVDKEKPRAMARSILFSGAMWLIGLCVLMHGLFQIGFTTWIGPYHAAHMGITPSEAALFISFNNAGFFPGRALLGWICARVKIPDLILLAFASGAGTLVILIILLIGNYWLALALSFVEGFFVAGDSPAMSSFVGGRFATRTALAYAIYGGFGQVGAAAGGYAIGFLGDFLGNLQRAIWIIPVVSGLLCLVATTWHFATRRSTA
jgi:MFS family permease